MDYFSIDCEASGPLPPTFNLLSIGATTLHEQRGKLTLGNSFYVELQPIFQRLGLNESEWLETVQHFGRRYRLAAGAADRLQAMGERLGRCWMQGIGFSRRAYRQAAVPG